MSTVQKGDVYLDRDGRRKGRTFKVEAVLDNVGKALVKPLSGGTKMTKISLSRFKPWKYELQRSTATSPTKTISLGISSTRTSVVAGPKVSASTSVVTKTRSLADQCQKVIPGSWKSDWPHVATLSQGCLGLVVRSFNNTAYDVKVQLDGLIVDTWSAKHLDLKTVLDHLRDKLSAMRDDFSAALN